MIGINDGHTISGFGTGAVGIIKESEHTRLVGNALRRILKEAGYDVKNCTVDYARSTSESLALIVEMANGVELTWFVSIHFNAGGGRGVEVYTYEGRQYEDAVQVCENIAALGFKNRGVKAGTGLYVIRKTKAKSMLIEVCFVDTEDANHYLQVGHEAVAQAIANALMKYATKPTPVPTPNPVNDWISRLQNECNVQGFSTQKVDNYPGPNTLNGCPTIRYGAKGNITKLIQERLGINTDGIFGEQTKQVVMAFQRANGLTPDAIVGRNTWKKLLGL